MAWNLYANVSWPPSQLIRFWSRSVYFPYFETGQIWGFPAFSGERMWQMAWNLECYCILTSLLDFGHGLLTVLIRRPLGLMKRVKFVINAFSGERMTVMAWDLAYRCILTTFRAALIVHGLLIFLMLVAFGLSENLTRLRRTQTVSKLEWFTDSVDLVDILILHDIIDKLLLMLNLQNWLDFGHGVLIKLILMVFWFSETG